MTPNGRPVSVQQVRLHRSGAIEIGDATPENADDAPVPCAVEPSSSGDLPLQSVASEASQGPRHGGEQSQSRDKVGGSSANAETPC